MALGKGCKAEEGWAGRQFRLMLEERKLNEASGHTQDDQLPQSTGTQGHRKTVDCVIMTRSYVESITRATALYTSGRTLQHAKMRRPPDHHPVCVQVECAPEFFRPKTP